MNRFMCGVFLLFICSLATGKTVILLPDGYNESDVMASLSSSTKGVIDTLMPDLTTPYSTWPSRWRITYEATKFSIQFPCSIVAILHGVYSTSSASKQCSLFIWNNSEYETPGDKILGVGTTASTSSSGTQWNLYTLPSPIYMASAFWVGNYEWSTSYPTTAFDSNDVQTFPARYRDSPDSGGMVWLNDDVDYLHGVIIKYEEGLDAMVSASPSPLILHIDSSTVFSKELPMTAIPELKKTQIKALTEKSDKYWEDIVPGEMVIGYKNTVDVKSASLNELGLTGKGISVNRELGANFVLVKIPGNLNDEKEFVRRMENNSHIKSIEPNRILRIQATPDDPYFGQQWDKTNLNAPGAWDLIGWGSDSISIGILDMGADYTHPDLEPQFESVKKGYDYIDNNDDPLPAGYHGTQCAGIAAAATNNGTGIAGVSNSRLYSLRIVKPTGEVEDTKIGQGIQWCIDNNVNVISMSIAGSPGSYSLTQCQLAWEAGCLLTASSGNNSSGATTPGITFPAGYPSVICVGSISSSNQRSYFSDYGPMMELIAPGEGVYATTSGGTYGPVNGTSFSCPNVSGCAALVWSAKPSLTNREVRKILNSTATDLGPAGWDMEYGYGKPNLRAAVLLASAPDTMGTITICNSSLATANLFVSNITYKSSWIFSVGPTDFTVAPGSSRDITVVVRARLTKGYYYDTLLVTTNDIGNPLYPIPITLRVGNVGIEESGTYVSDFKVSPNPFTKFISVSFNVSKAENISLKIYDKAGRELKTLINEPMLAGNYSSTFNAEDLSSGVYFVSLKAGDKSVNKKITLIR